MKTLTLLWVLDNLKETMGLKVNENATPIKIVAPVMNTF